MAVKMIGTGGGRGDRVGRRGKGGERNGSRGGVGWNGVVCVSGVEVRWWKVRLVVGVGSAWALSLSGAAAVTVTLSQMMG